MSELGLNTLPE